jgi:3-deoxy-D-manno-octulosonic-acid transferase
MSKADASVTVRDAAEIAREIGRLVEDDELRRQRVSASQAVAAAKQGILDRIVAELAPLLEDQPDDHAQA